MKEQVPYNLIAKYFSGQIDDEGNEKLLQWRSESAENEHLFEELKNEWNLISTNPLENPVIPDKEKIWQNVLSKISKPVKVYSRSFMIRTVSIAASITLILGLSFSLLFRNDSKRETLYSTISTPEGHKSSIVLADGSKVWLNSSSSITYGSDYGVGERLVKLKGEAFFDVRKNSRIKFVVDAGNLSVQVHGTTFNVKAYPKDKEISVALVTGKVHVINNKSQNLIAELTPGEKITVEKDDYKQIIQKTNTESDGVWRFDKLKFEGAEITEVAEKLSSWYGVEIIVTDINKHPKYWFSVRNEPLTDILNSMDRLHPIKYKIKDNKVIISNR